MSNTKQVLDDIISTKPLESITDEDFTDLMKLLNEKNEGDDVQIAFTEFQGSGDRKKFLKEKFGVTDGNPEIVEKPQSGRWRQGMKDGKVNPHEIDVLIGDDKKFDGEHGGKRRSRKRRSSKKKRKNKKSKKSRKAKKSRKSRK